MNWKPADQIDVGDTIMLSDGEDYRVDEKNIEINGQVGLLVTILGDKNNGRQSRAYLDPKHQVGVVESKAEQQARREQYENTVGDSTDTYYQNKRERDMGL